MKQVTNKKLLLNKVTVASLGNNQLNQVKGGTGSLSTIISSCTCSAESRCICEPPEKPDPNIPAPQYARD